MRQYNEPEDECFPSSRIYIQIRPSKLKNRGFLACRLKKASSGCTASLGSIFFSRPLAVGVNFFFKTFGCWGQFLQVFLSFACKYYLQILLANITCKYYLQILLANFTCKLYLQIILANFSCKFYLQILLAYFTCKFYLQILLANFNCKF